ncbi:MAG: HIT family protein [Thermoplasmata archaeon]|nr:HIT family protein [Thermoplasmata archaeon]
MTSPDGRDGPCIFCEIVAGRAAAHRVYEDDRTIAFLDLFPITRGHVLVVPKRHVDRLTDLRDEEYGDLFRALAKVCRMTERLSMDYNVAVNQGALAGQIVFHLHFHIIPRYDTAGPFATTPRTRIRAEEAQTVLRSLGDVPS